MKLYTNLTMKCFEIGNKTYRRAVMHNFITLKADIMKNILSVGTLIIGIIIATSCGQKEDKKSQNLQIDEQIDTSGYFIASILNSTPKEVAKLLGEPDGGIKPSNDCLYLPSCYEATYQNNKYEVLYYKNKLKWLYIGEAGHMNKDAISYAGFPSCVPTFSNPPHIISWRSNETKGTATGPLLPIKGLREFTVFPDYLFITVETNHNSKFDRLDKQTRDNSLTETQKQEKVEAERLVRHKKMIEAQFSSWDGSHINLTKAIKDAMNDPDSYEHISTKYFDLGDHIKVVTEFRGTNSFGAKVLFSALGHPEGLWGNIP